MTQPGPDTIERAKQYVTDAELIRWLGVPEKIARTIGRTSITVAPLIGNGSGLHPSGNIAVGRQHARAYG